MLPLVPPMPSSDHHSKLQTQHCLDTEPFPLCCSQHRCSSEQHPAAQQHRRQVRFKGVGDSYEHSAVRHMVCWSQLGTAAAQRTATMRSWAACPGPGAPEVPEHHKRTPQPNLAASLLPAPSGIAFAKQWPACPGRMMVSVPLGCVLLCCGALCSALRCVQHRPPSSSRPQAAAEGEVPVVPGPGQPGLLHVQGDLQ